MTQLPPFLPDEGTWTAYCDGASRGNPGPASFGVVVCNGAGSVVAEVGVALGVNTNQAAEAAAEASVRAARVPAASLQILGMVRSAKGDREGATAALEQAVRLDPDEPQGRLLLSRAYREQGRLNQACTLLRGLPTELSPQVKDGRADCPEP